MWPRDDELIRAQFHGSAYRKQRIGAYGSKDFRAYGKYIAKEKQEIFAWVRAYSTLLGILRLRS